MKKSILILHLGIIIFSFYSCSDSTINPPVPVVNHSEITRIMYSIYGGDMDGRLLIMTPDSIYYEGLKNHTDTKYNFLKPMSQSIWDSVTNSINVNNFMNLDSVYGNPDIINVDGACISISINTKNKYKEVKDYIDTSIIKEITGIDSIAYSLINRFGGR